MLHPTVFVEMQGIGMTIKLYVTSCARYFIVSRNPYDAVRC